MLIRRLVKNINLSRKHTQVFRARNQMLSIDKKNNQFFRISLIQYLSKWALGISFRSVAPWISGEETLQRPMLCIRFFCEDRQMYFTTELYRPSYLVQTQIAMSLSNSLPKAVRKGIQHAVMRVDRRQSVFLQLISHNANQLLHPFIIVCPVTDNLEKR